MCIRLFYDFQGFNVEPKQGNAALYAQIIKSNDEMEAGRRTLKGLIINSKDDRGKCVICY